MKVISDTDLQDLIETARASPRKRKNHNLHPVLEDPVQRLCNAFEPGTYLRPHRHPEAGRWELFVMLKGKAAILTFDQNGQVDARVELSAQGPNRIIEIPPDTWHTLVSLQDGTVLFEIKQGPYHALTDKDFAVWAPPENDAHAADFVAWYEIAQPGDVAPVINA